MVGRLRAEEELRHLQGLASAGSVEAYGATSNALKEELGTVYVWEEKAFAEVVVDPDTGLDPEFDRAGLHALWAEHRH